MPVLYVLLNNGVSEDPTTRFFQIGGLTESFLSVSKFCAEWHLFTAFNLNEDFETKIPTKLLPVFKAMSFFVPHTVFRTASLPIVAAYFRLYALIPLSIFVIVGSYAVDGEIRCFGIIAALFTLPLYIFTPATFQPDVKGDRKLLKSTMLLSTLFLLPSYVSNHMGSFINVPVSNVIYVIYVLVCSGKSRFAQPADLLKVFEAVLEANIQGIIGTIHSSRKHSKTFCFPSSLCASEQRCL